MIQINLLPDIKQELIRAQRTRNYVISLSIIVGLASLGVVVLLGLLVGGQMVRDSLADSQIDSEYKELSETADITEVLTMQNQLVKISDLHGQRSMNSRIFDVLLAVNPPEPNTVTYTSVRTNLNDRTLTIEGTAPDYPAIETLKKTITNAKLSIVQDGETQESELVTDIQDGSTSLGEDSSGNRVVRFSMTLSYIEGLFDNTIKKAEIVLPQGRVDVTDSRGGVPSSLFAGNNATEEEQN